MAGGWRPSHAVPLTKFRCTRFRLRMAVQLQLPGSVTPRIAFLHAVHDVRILLS